MKPLSDYSHIRGICCAPAMPDPRTGDRTRMNRDLEFCKRLNLNSTRFWMSQQAYERDPESYIARVKEYVQICYEHGITSMPILWNGNPIHDFTPPTEEEWEKMEAYAKAVIDALRDEPGLLMWDVINEPMCNDYMNAVKGTDQYEVRFAQLEAYVRRMTKIVRSLDSENCITVGHENWSHCRSSNDLVDVISFHDYTGTRAEMENAILQCKQMSEELGKPILNTETGCVGRANPYDVELEMCAKHKVGWYLFLLVHEGFWSDIHGLVYPDGTVRDPAVVSALFGFYRNRGENIVQADVNQEDAVTDLTRRVAMLMEGTRQNRRLDHGGDAAELLELCEYAANLLEAGELTPMHYPPTARVAAYRRQETPNVEEIKDWLFAMLTTLRQACHLV